MRRILKKIAANDLNDLGDVSTLTDLSVVDSLIKNRKNLWYIKINIYSNKYLWKIINFIYFIINILLFDYCNTNCYQLVPLKINYYLFNNIYNNIYKFKILN